MIQKSEDRSQKSECQGRRQEPGVRYSPLPKACTAFPSPLAGEGQGGGVQKAEHGSQQPEGYGSPASDRCLLTSDFFLARQPFIAPDQPWRAARAVVADDDRIMRHVARAVRAVGHGDALVGIG